MYQNAQEGHINDKNKSAEALSYSSSGRRQNVTNYNLDHLSYKSYHQAMEELQQQTKRRSHRKKNAVASYADSDATNSSQQLNGRKRKANEEFVVGDFDEICDLERITKLSANGGRRNILARLNDFPKFANAGGGFMLFLKRSTDTVLKEICRKISDLGDERGVGDMEELTYMAQAMRYAWNKTSEQERLKWEKEARNEAKLKIVSNMEYLADNTKEKPTNDMAEEMGEVVSQERETEDAVMAIATSDEMETNENDRPEGDTLLPLPTSGDHGSDMDVDNQSEKSTLVPKKAVDSESVDLPISMDLAKKLPPMPLCERRFRSVGACESKAEAEDLRKFIVRCPLCKKKDAVRGLQAHILQDHYNAHFYGCHCCFEAFPSVDALKKHPCSEFASYVVQFVDGRYKCELRFAMHTLMCAECNMQLPLASTSDGIAFITRLLNMVRFHNCDSLVSCVVYFYSNPVGVEYVTVRGVSLRGSISLRCPHCGIAFTSAQDIDRHQLCEHGQVVNRLKCPGCPRSFATQLFYRDHLLTHLGEINSMVPIIEQTALMAPASMANATPKMGPRLEPICGGMAAELARIDYSSEISEEEDVTMLRSDMARKRAMAEAKQSHRRSHEGKCYACKQIKQMTTRRTRSDQCRCASSLSVASAQSDIAMGPGPLEYVQLIKSICEKFKREGRLYVGSRDSMHDPTRGAIIQSSVYYCVKCDGITLGDESTVRHLRICTQKELTNPDLEKNFDLRDTDVVVRLTHPMAPFNTRVCCPQCDKLSCSIPGLRYHLVLAHGIFAPFKPQGAAGILEFNSDGMRVTTLAEIVNEQLELTKDGNFQKKMTRQPQRLHINETLADLTPSSSKSPRRPAVPNTIIRAFEGNENATVANRAMPSAFQCPICFQGYYSGTLIARHFSTYHMHVCIDCGQGFSEEGARDAHKRNCKGWPTEGNNNLRFLPHCPICNKTSATPARYFFHLVQFHCKDIKIQKPSHQILPMFIWKTVSNEEFQQMAHSVAATPTSNEGTRNVTRRLSSVAQTTALQALHPKGSAQAQQRALTDTPASSLSVVHCYLCEMPFREVAELQEHYAGHKEQWAACPVCVSSLTTYEVNSIDELFDHILTHHVQISQGVKMMCMICFMSMTTSPTESIQSNQEQMVRHILYACNSPRRCFLCNDTSMMNPDVLKQHRTKVHSDIYERFGCSMCPKRFFVYSSFAKHVCNTRVMCSCGNRVLYTEREFEEHFTTHLNMLGDFCLLCTKYLSTKQQQASHRSFHRTVLMGARSLTQVGDEPPQQLNGSVQPQTEAQPHAQGHSKKHTANVKTVVAPDPLGKTPPKAGGDRFQFRTVKPDSGGSDDDIIIIETPSANDSAAQAATSKRSRKRRQSESAAASSSLTALMAEAAGESAVPTTTSTAPAVPIPSNFMANVRVEAVGPTAQEPHPVCAQSTEVVAALHISLDETDEEAVEALVGKMLTTLCGGEEDFTEASDEGSAGSGLVASRTNEEDGGAEDGELDESLEEGELSRSPVPQAEDDNGEAIGTETETEAGATTAGAVDNDGNLEGDLEPGGLMIDLHSDERMEDSDDDDVLIIDDRVEQEQTEQQVEEAGNALREVLHVGGEGGQLSTPTTKGVGGEQVDDDDDDVCVVGEFVRSEDKPPAQEGTVKVIEGEGDDEMQIVAEVEGPGIGQIKIRDKQFQCSRCTAMYLTKSALEAHRETHRYDAGNTSDKVFGVPLNTVVYVCRLCCLAYESREVFRAHSAAHGNLFSCELCSVVTFNEEQFRVHSAQHVASANSPRIVYVCAFCVVTYSSDERLYHHMLERHNLVVLYFCKHCGFASTDGKVVYWHIALSECSGLRNRATTTSDGPMGFTAACAFHYQPVNEAEHENRLAHRSITVVIPSECVHRSFLMSQNEHVSITCSTCFVLMSYLRLTVERPEFTSVLPRAINPAADDNGVMLTRLTQVWRAPTTTASRGGGTATNRGTGTRSRKGGGRNGAKTTEGAMVEGGAASSWTRGSRKGPNATTGAVDAANGAIGASASSTTTTLSTVIRASGTVPRRARTRQPVQRSAGTAATLPAQSPSRMTVNPFVASSTIAQAVGYQQGGAASSVTTAGRQVAATGTLQMNQVNGYHHQGGTAASATAIRIGENVTMPANVNLRLRGGPSGAVTGEYPDMSSSNRSSASITMGTVRRVVANPQSGVLRSVGGTSAARATPLSQQAPHMMRVTVPQGSPSFRFTPVSSLSTMSSSGRPSSGTASSHRYVVSEVPSTSTGNMSTQQGLSHASSASSSSSEFDSSVRVSRIAQNNEQGSSHQVPQSKDYIVRAGDGYVCTWPECQGLHFDKIASGHVHNLRHNVHNSHFCLECGLAFPSEQVAVKHQIEVHNNNMLPAMSLQCPLCDPAPQFDSLEKLKVHLRDQTFPKHLNLQHHLRIPRCSLNFATVDSMVAHETEHLSSGTGECCLLCGTGRGYWITAAHNGTPAMNHTMFHAFMMWGMCRDCGLCFANEVKKDQFVRHFTQAHIEPETSRCRTCRITVPGRRIMEHALSSHFVVGMKRDRTKPFAVQSSNPLMLNYLGFNIPGCTRI